jgi:flagellar biosynthesis GTPase FlhF
MKPKEKPQALPFSQNMEMLSAAVQPETLDDKARTVQCAWYTGATVPRFSFSDGPYNLTLSMETGACNMDRLNNGAPLLKNHNDYSLDNVVGVVEKAWIADGQYLAVVRFSERADVDPIWQDVKNGILRNLSVGAAIYSKKDTTGENDKIKCYLATSWEPMELSIVPIPADASAQFLSAQAAGEKQVEQEKLELLKRATAQIEEEKMDEEKRVQALAAEAQKEAELKKAREEGAELERQRVTEIQKLGKSANLDETFVQGLISSNESLDSARDKMFAELLKKQAAQPETRGARAEVVRDADVTRMAAIENALLHRHDPKTYKLEAGRDFHGLSLIEVAREVLSAHGISHRGMSKMEVARLAFASVSDFPLILANVGNKTLRAAYAAYPQTWKAIAKASTANDFKTLYRNQLSESPTLTKVGVNGEFKYAKLTEARESYFLSTYGQIIAVNRQTIINDDLGQFTRVPESQGRAAAQMESDVVWALITGNPTMAADSVLLFDVSTHKNYTTSSGTAISVTSLGVARGMMRNQKNLQSAEVLNLVPKFLAVPVGKEGIAELYVSKPNPTKADDVNNFAPGGRTPLELIVEPRLDVASATAWYLFGDVNQCDIIEYAYLAGQEGIYTETRMGFDVDGMELKVREDFGAQILDWRNCYKNYGA